MKPRSAVDSKGTTTDSVRILILESAFFLSTQFKFNAAAFADLQRRFAMKNFEGNKENGNKPKKAPSLDLVTA